MLTKNARIACFVIATVVYVSAANAAVVSYTSDVFDNVTDVSTNGTLVTAVNLGHGLPNGGVDTGPATTAVTVNSVTFTSEPGTGTNDFIVNESDFHDINTYNDANTITGLSAADANALLDSLAFGPGVGNSRARVSGLTIGNSYEIQLLMARASYNFGHSTPSGDATETYTLLNIATAPPAVVTGTFVATETVQDFHIANTGAGANAEVNAFQLRDVTPTVPEPSTFVLALAAMTGLTLRLRRRRR